MNGVSTTSCPIQPKHTESAKKNQKIQILKGLKKLLLIDEVSTTGNKTKITIAKPINTTPPNLSGILLKIA